MNKNSTLEVIDYVLQHEYDDYIDQCEENGYDPKDVAGNTWHIYGLAVKAFELETGNKLEVPNVADQSN